MNKIPCASQNTEAETLPADVCVFGHFGRFLLATAYSADCHWAFEVKWWIHVSSIVTYLRKNFLLHWNWCKQHWNWCKQHWNWCKQHSESSMYCFWSTGNKRSNHYEDSSLIDKCSCKIVNTSSSDIFTSSATSRNFNLWSAKTSFLYFSRQLPNLDDLSFQHHLCLYDFI